MLFFALLACADPPSTASGAPTPPVEEAVASPPAARRFASAAEALKVVLASDPRVLGVGEVHATTDGPSGTTTIARFTTELLPVLAPRTSDLVIETWRLDGACGAPAAAVVDQVEVDTKRPAETKSEIVILGEAALAAGVKPHDLIFACAEYQQLLGPDGAVLYDALLRLLTQKLGDYAAQALARPDARLVLYGGAMHNDLFPHEGAEAYSYGLRARETGGASYVELDLYDPALVVGKALFVEAAWEPLLAEAGPDHVLLIERGPQSYVLLLPTATP